MYKWSFKQILIIPISIALMLLITIIVIQMVSFDSSIEKQRMYEEKINEDLRALVIIEKNLTKAFRMYYRNVQNIPTDSNEVGWLLDDLNISIKMLGDSDVKRSSRKVVTEITDIFQELKDSGGNYLTEEDELELADFIADSLDDMSIDIQQHNIYLKIKNEDAKRVVAKDVLLKIVASQLAIKQYLASEKSYRNDVVETINPLRKYLDHLIEEDQEHSQSVIVLSKNTKESLHRLLQLISAVYDARDIGDTNRESLSGDLKSSKSIYTGMLENISLLSEILAQSMQEEKLKLSQDFSVQATMFQILAFLAVFLAIATLSVLVIQLQKRVRLLILATEHYARHNMEYRSPIIGNCEFSQLAIALNFMAEQITIKDKLAFHDNLTGLPNRLLFFERLQQACSYHHRNNLQFAVLFIDLDRFKVVNDTLGHHAGDLLLVEISQRIKSAVLRGTDTTSRLGGDEFTVILTNVQQRSDCSKVCMAIIDLLTQPVIIAGEDVLVGCSIGISMYPSDGTEVSVLTRHADLAMYEAKKRGRGTYVYFRDM
jgi:diguanylate cyclase (GGDEF)-like protein